MSLVLAVCILLLALLIGAAVEDGSARQRNLPPEAPGHRPS
jgi:hypothetical protein